MSENRYKSRGRTSLFDIPDILSELSNLGDPLARLNKAINFEMFREELENSMLNHDKKSKCGCKRYDVVMMFKILLLKRYYGLSDEQAQFQITDRLTFRNFLGLSLGDKVPDARTIWLFQDRLIKNELEKRIFDLFYAYSDSLGIIGNEGKVIDATFVIPPCQRNKKEENEKIKLGKGSELWISELRKKCQKDVDASWTQKGGRNYFGYKSHTKIDTKSKLIDKYEVTTAKVHDSQVVAKLISKKDKGQEIHGDSAYTGSAVDGILRKAGIIPQIIKRSVRGKPLTEEEKAENRIKSKIRCRVEHVFGFIKNSMGGFFIRCIGYKRARGVIGLTNLVYNLCRYEQIVRLNLLPVK